MFEKAKGFQLKKYVQEKYRNLEKNIFQEAEESPNKKKKTEFKKKYYPNSKTKKFQWKKGVQEKYC